MPKSRRFTITWNTEVKMVLPPGVPMTRVTFPASSSSSVGVMEDSMRFPGWISLAVLPMTPKILGVPGLALKSSISLLRRKPAPSTTTPLPKAQLMV